MDSIGTRPGAVWLTQGLLVIFSLLLIGLAAFAATLLSSFHRGGADASLFVLGVVLPWASRSCRRWPAGGWRGENRMAGGSAWFRFRSCGRFCYSCRFGERRACCCITKAECPLS
jgi:hypothetical protein